MLKNKIVLLSVFVSLVVPFSLASAQTQRLPGVVDQQILPDAEITPTRSLDLDKAPSSPLEKEPQLNNIKNPKAVVLNKLKSVSFSGNQSIKNQELQEIAAPYLNKALTEQSLARLKFAVKKAFYEKGYILTHIVTPPQNVSSGSLQIKIYEAKVGAVNINDNGTIHSWLAQNIAKRSKPGKVIKEQDIESMISDFDDLEDVKARLALRPGQTVGTTDLNVILESDNEDVHTVGVNNYNSELTGENLTYANFEHSNLFKMGEKLRLGLQKSDKDLWSINVGAITPIGIRNINLETSYLHSENDIKGRLKVLRASGESDIFNAALSSKIINTRSRELVLKAGLQKRTHESFLADISDTKDEITRAYLSGSYLIRTAKSVVYTTAKLSKGVDLFGASEKGEANATRTAGDPDVWMFEPAIVTYVRPFSKGGTIKTVVRGQFSSNKQLSSDLFSIGGYYSVRGFKVAQESGENAYSFNLEYEHTLPININKITFKAGPFIDGAAIYNKIDGTVQDNHFYSAGLGFEAVADVVPGGKTSLRLDWAHPIGNYASNQVSSDTLYFNIKQTF